MSEYETIALENGPDDHRERHDTLPFQLSPSPTTDEVTDLRESSTDHHNEGIREQVAWTEYDHIHTAMYIAPVWFIANWSYNSSLIYTTITSSTVLASTGSLFTYLFAIATKDEQINTMKIVGIVMGVLGSFITTLSDTTSSSATTPTNISIGASSNDDFTYHVDPVNDAGNRSSTSSSSAMLPMLGDILGVISAIGYGAYAVQTRIYCPKNESLYSMQTLLGYIGLCNFVVLSPFAMYLIISGQSQLSWMIVGFLVLKGLFDNVLSDYLWLRAVILTNATTATVGLGLTIPLAFASDILLGKQNVLQIEQIVGAIVVLVGFVLVNVGNNESDMVSSGVATANSDTSERSDPGRYSQVPPADLDENKSQRGQEIVLIPNIHSES